MRKAFVHYDSTGKVIGQSFIQAKSIPEQSKQDPQGGILEFDIDEIDHDERAMIEEMKDNFDDFEVDIQQGLLKRKGS